ncbi:hypothetical protein SARC_17728, partial [Sphaeroforma arctica JP610]
ALEQNTKGNTLQHELIEDEGAVAGSSPALAEALKVVRREKVMLQTKLNTAALETRSHLAQLKKKV